MRTCLCVSVTQRAINILCSRSRLLSHDSPNRKRGVVKREPIANRWYGKKASRVTLTTWKGVRPASRTFLFQFFGNYLSVGYPEWD